MSMSWAIHVIDDDDAVRASLLFALRATGFSVSGYAEANEFLACRREERSVLICDVRMPGVNGIELSRLLRQHGSTMPVILMTGNASPTLKEEAMSAGAATILEKPAALAGLLAEIARVTADWE